MQPGARRRRLDETLRVAYSEGLLSETTFVARLERVLSARTVDPPGLVGDLTIGASRGPRAAVHRLTARITMWPRRRTVSPLALDWSGAAAERLLVGRAPESDIELCDETVSRRHAELLWRSGTWVVHDLGSRNGTMLNGRRVERAQLRPGDYLSFARHTVRVD
ncbi:MAG TPA: FHA domain-containing protein [Solirubrobacteraceae bacterium]|nr:FHA domain-containing protein [Solirubrobacteraceae bacterium]